MLGNAFQIRTQQSEDVATLVRQKILMAEYNASFVRKSIFLVSTLALKYFVFCTKPHIVFGRPVMPEL